MKNKLKQKIEYIDKILDKELNSIEGAPETIINSMKYSIFAGGKRLRPIMLLETLKCLDENIEIGIPLACSIEMIHTYSLIHDDLPAMDNDDYRRGKLTNHKVYGDAIAILAGDALLNYAFEVIISHFPDSDNSILIKNYLNAFKEISNAAGIYGMIGGQVADIESEGMEINIDKLKYIHKNKTGALIKASVRAGAFVGNANIKQLEALTLYSEKIGLAFQIVDDILDIVGDSKKMGKMTGGDQKNNKLTYPSYYGLDESKETVNNLLEESLKSLEIFGERANFLRELAIFICKRDY